MKVIERIDDSCCRVRFEWRVRFYFQVIKMGYLEPYSVDRCSSKFDLRKRLTP
jgi:hypothetical protein